MASLYYTMFKILISCIFVFTTTSHAFFRGHISYRNIINSRPLYDTPDMTTAITNKMPLVVDDPFRLGWYVIADAKQIRQNKPFKATIWDKEYVVWKTEPHTYTAIDDRCPHRGASLSLGKLTHTNEIICPYHGYEFNQSGVLTYVPGLDHKNTPCQNLNHYRVVEHEGWVYINTIPNAFLPENMAPRLYTEPEATQSTFNRIFIQSNFEAYARTVSENSLDVMHIGFVHTFGNKEQPSPIKEVPPHIVNGDPLHYRTQYEYKSGKDSLVKRLYKIPELRIENEFILPHTTIARVIFGDFISTVITFATPVNMTHTRLFVKTYRNFWNSVDNTNPFSYWINYIGNKLTTNMMTETVNQDKCVIQNIPLKFIDGRFNMKFDKLQNVYRSMYKRLVHNVTGEIDV